MTASINHEFINLGRGETFIKNFHHGEIVDNKRKEIFICLAIKNKQASAEIMTENIFKSAEEIFFRSNIEDSYKKFESTLKEINRIIKKFEEESLANQVGQISSVIGSIDDDILHLSQNGEAEAYLLRGKHLNIISEGLNDVKNNNYFVNIASGKIENSDIIIFCSTRLLKHITKQELCHIFQPDKKIEKELENLKDILESESLDQMGINILKLLTAKETEKEKGMSFNLDIKKNLTKILNHPFLQKLFKREKKEKKPPIISSDLILSGIKNLKKLLKISPEKPDPNFRKKQILGALVVTCLLLIFSIFFINLSGEKNELIKKYETILSDVKDDIDNAYTIGIVDKEKATKILLDAEMKVQEVLSSGFLRLDAAAKLDMIQEVKDKLDGIKTVENLRLIADLKQNNASFEALLLNNYSSHLAAIGNNEIHEVILEKVAEAKKIEGEEIIDANYFEDQKALILATKSNKIVEYKDSNFEFMDTKDLKWKNGIDIKSFGNKLYLLDKINNQIWKYTRSRENYGVAEAYISGKIDFGKVVDMAIDGSVYLLEEDGNIRKLYGGVEEKITFKKQPITKISKADKIFTSYENPNLFVMNKADKVINVYSKDSKNATLTYGYQLKFPKITNLKDFYVDKNTNKIYILDDNKIFEANL